MKQRSNVKKTKQKHDGTTEQKKKKTSLGKIPNQQNI